MASWADDAAKNAALWTQSNAEYTDERAADNWALDSIHWGIWSIDETELNVLGDVAGLDVVELGCGTAYFSAWLAKRGARPIGVDITPAQLDTARRQMAETGIEFPLIEADAAVTGLPNASADLVLSEYGASIWVDPYRWIPEASRLLRPGGRLVFLRNSTLVILCSPDEVPASETLQRPQFGMHRFEWPDDGVEFHLPHGEWIDLLRANGFDVERLIEIQAPADAETHHRYSYVTAEWAKQWPCEEIWGGAQAGVSSSSAPPLVLASTSPQRRAILQQLGVPFEVVAPDYEELPGTSPLERAAGKARSLEAGDRPVLGVDTEVLLDGELLGKPANETEAEAMLASLAGRTHEVVSGLCLRTPAWEELHSATTRVTFRPLVPRDLGHYVAAGEWEGRAGAYAIQGLGAALVERIEGDFVNVVGLPAALLVDVLARRFAGLYGFG